MFKGMNMLKIAIASLFSKNKKYAANSKIQGSVGSTNGDGMYWYS